MNLNEKIFQLFEQRVKILDKDILEKYIEFCITKSDEYCVGEEHHILPRAHFPEYVDLKIHTYNRVKLSYTNHLKAHYLLVLSIDSVEMLYAFNMMNNFYNTNNIANLENYEKLKKQFCEMLKTSKWANWKKGARWMYMSGKYELVPKEKIDNYLSNGWIFQGNSTNTVWKNNGVIDKRVSLDDIEYKNWEFGRVNFKEREDSTWINNGNTKKLILTSELDDYLQKNWVKGSGEFCKTTKGYIRISKNNKNKSIQKEDLEEYLNNGWVIGAYCVYCSDCHAKISSLGKQNHICKGKNYEYKFYTK